MTVKKSWYDIYRGTEIIILDNKIYSFLKSLGLKYPRMPTDYTLIVNLIHREQFIKLRVSKTVLEYIIDSKGDIKSCDIVQRVYGEECPSLNQEQKYNLYDVVKTALRMGSKVLDNILFSVEFSERDLVDLKDTILFKRQPVEMKDYKNLSYSRFIDIRDKLLSYLVSRIQIYRYTKQGDIDFNVFVFLDDNRYIIGITSNGVLLAEKYIFRKKRGYVDLFM